MVALEALLAKTRKDLEELQAENARLHRLLQLKDEKLRLALLQRFGPKGEKLAPGQIQLLLQELSLTLDEVDQEADLPEAAKPVAQPKARSSKALHPGRETLPEHLERREEIIACHPEECRCRQCGAERPVMGYEVREELACDEPKFWVRVIKREKRASHCVEEEGVATAPAPAQIVPKGKLSNEFIIEVLARKYQQHLPIYRQCAELWTNHGIELSRKTLGEAVLAAGALLVPVVRAQAEQLKARGYLQADETTLPCQTAEKSGQNHRAYLWEYGEPRGAVVFDFRMGRGREGPREFLRGFAGTLQCDGYGAYAQLGEGIVYAGCMAHARRGFVDAAKVAPNDPRPGEIIAVIGKLYAVEEEARTAGMNADARRKLRQEKSVALMAGLKGRIVALRQELAPGGALARACDYTLGQWERLEVFLQDGRVEIDNNWCEGSMRGLALGRKNWLHVGSAEAGPKVAAIASIVETCRRLKVNLRAYLRDVLPRLGDWPIQRVAELTPAAWQARQNS